MGKHAIKNREVKYFLLKNDIFQFDVVVQIGGEKKKLITYIEDNFEYKLTDEEKEHLNSPEKLGTTMILTNKAIAVWVKNWPKDATTIAILIHELFHATEFIMSSANIQHSDETSEVFAYVLDFLVRAVLKELE